MENVNVGVDVGLRRLAVASWDFGFADSVQLPKPTAARPANRANELNLLARWLWDVLSENQLRPEHVNLWVERSYVGNSVGNPATAMGLAETVGAVLTAGQWAQAERVDASTWKMNLLGPGKGHASKEMVEAWLRSEWPQLVAVCGTEDQVDAMCISMYGQMRDDGRASAPTKVRRKKASNAGRTPADA